MAYSARVLLDSVSPLGVRLTTLEVTFPRFVLAEFNTHRMFSRNSASSRAIPTAKLIERVEQDPVLPLEWGRNKAGMSASDLLSAEEAEAAQRVWLRARDDAIARARELLDLKVHKQELNRILEPFLWHTVIVTATQWDNFFELRCSSNAQPEIRKAAMLNARGDRCQQAAKRSPTMRGIRRCCSPTRATCRSKRVSGFRRPAARAFRI